MNGTSNDAAARPLIELEHLCVEVTAGPGRGRRVVDDVSLALHAGECLALVGESGSGKTLTAFSALGLYPAPGVARVAGVVRFKGRELSDPEGPEWQGLRGRHLGVVFQEPARALSPVRRVGAHLADVLAVHAGLTGAAARERALALLAEVGLPEASSLLRSYACELSGGMQQRVCVALALAGSPEVVIADEPTAALDPTVGAHVLGLLDRLRRSRGLAVLLVSHDLAQVARLADRVAVLRAGRVVEQGPTAEVLTRPQQAYTRALCAARTLGPDGRYAGLGGEAQP
jgi:ABC-type glutathione transport system ATPase component